MKSKNSKLNRPTALRSSAVLGCNAPPVGGKYNVMEAISESMGGEIIGKLEELGVVPIWKAERRWMAEVIETHRFYRQLVEDILWSIDPSHLKRSRHEVYYSGPRVLYHDWTKQQRQPKGQYNRGARKRHQAKSPNQNSAAPSKKSRQSF